MLRLLLIVFALVTGGGAGLVGYQATLQGPPPASAAAEPVMVEVLAPTVDLLRGARLAEHHLGWTAWPESRVAPGMILRSADPDAPARFLGRHVRSNLYAGDPVRAQAFAEGDGGYLALTLAPSMRAIGVQVNATKTAGGFIMPNDRVDVLLTVIRDLDGDGAATGASRTILTNLRVLAIGETTYDAATRVKPPAGGAAPQEEEAPTTIAGKTATLEVSPEQAEILLAASASGQLSLALRAAEDFGLSSIGDLEMIERPKGEEAASPPPPPPPVATLEPAAPRKRQVTIIGSGAARTVVAEWGSAPND